MSRRIVIFDTTLRDGEQSPGASMNTEEKLIIARQLLRLGVDVIEAGFPASSPGDFESVRAVAAEVGDKAVVCALARAIPADIEKAAEALVGAQRPRLHTGIGVSAIHLRGKLHINSEQAIERAVSAVKRARTFTDDVQFYAEDAGRSDPDLLARMFAAVIAAGATTLCAPDTTGFSLPADYGALITYVREHTPGIENVVLAAHCHNDLGMATASTIAGIAAGVGQVECTINGLGERAGNAALEEVVMALRLHGAELDVTTSIETTELTRASRLVSQITGIKVQPNKAVVGANAFVHASGIHQDGVLKKRTTYEILDPVEVGLNPDAIVLSARSGHAALRARLETLGLAPNEADEKGFDQIYERFLTLADRKKEVYDEDLEALMAEYDRTQNALWALATLQVSCGVPLIATATVVLTDQGGSERLASATGTGPIDAAYKAVDAILQVDCDLKEYVVQAITRGIDALGEVTVRVEAPDGRIFTGRGADGDIIVSSTKAYLNALNRMLCAG
ncbi:MAG: 2-isopropylmalate synthase [Coriobacteriales bacterium]|nr:2-isopropylmalate synthase [Coriobacteriales bacterium]